MIWIRADANKEIGAGHVMRCISIAQELKRIYHERVCFLVADENPVALLESRGMEYRVLHSDYRKLEEEIEALEALIEEERPSVLLVDSYFATEGYLGRLSKSVRVAYLDDLGRKNLSVHLLINYNIFAEEGMCLGASYVPLRAEFRDVEYKVRRQVGKIFVTTGGSDKYNLAGKYLKTALERPGVNQFAYCVVSGAYNEHLEELRALEAEHDNVHIYCNVSNMAQLMRECDVAVTAGGSTVYELAAVGVPMICFSFAENQRRLVETMDTRGYAKSAGDYLTDGDVIVDRMVEETAGLSADYERRQAVSERLKTLVDGCGAARIAEALMNC